MQTEKKKNLRAQRVMVSDTAQVELALMEKEDRAKEWKPNCPKSDDPRTTPAS